MDYKDPEKLAKAIVDWLEDGIKIALEQSAEYAKSKIAWEFKTESEATGKPWEALDSKYLEKKIKQGYSEKTLHRTTRLKRSFFKKVEKEKAIIGTPVKYAIFHEEGTKKMPARPILKPILKELEKEFGDILEGSLKKAGKE